MFEEGEIYVLVSAIRVRYISLRSGTGSCNEEELGALDHIGEKITSSKSCALNIKPRNKI